MTDLDVQAIVHGLNDAAILTDAMLRPLHYNNAFALLVGLRRRQLEMQIERAASVFDLIVPMQAAHLERAVVAAASGRAMRLEEIPVRSAAGGEAVVGITLVPLGADAERRLVISFRDVTAEAKLQERYKEMLAVERARADQLERAVAQRTKELTAALEEVTRLSRTDPLTGLANRRSFNELAETAIENARRHGRVVGLLISDLDHFKSVNDTYGHEAGDKVLVVSAQAMQRSLRATDRIARFGGEEFVILLAETEPDKIAEVAERFVAAVRDIDVARLIPGKERQTISIGAAYFPVHGDSLNDVLANADRALYAAKQSGRNRAVIFDRSMDDAPAELELPRALWISWTDGGDDKGASSLQGVHQVVHTVGRDAALAAMLRETFASVIIEGNDDALDADVLRALMVSQAAAVRVMIVDNTNVYTNLGNETFGAVDLFLLSRDLAELPRALTDAQRRRQAGAQAPKASITWRSRAHAQARAEIERVLNDGGIRMVYQPIIELATGEPIAYEALCRVESPQFAHPGEFFELALDAGLLWMCSREVRKRVAADMVRIPEGRLVFVNLHPADFADPTFLVGDTPPEAARRRMVLEVTERAAIPDFDTFAHSLSQLRGLGYRVAVDDLGAGYAALSSLALFNPEFTKIDMALTRGLTVESNKGKLVKRIIEFAADCGTTVIAEGVETAQEAAALANIQCRFAQGYHFARPSAI